MTPEELELILMEAIKDPDLDISQLAQEIHGYYTKPLSTVDREIRKRIEQLEQSMRDHKHSYRLQPVIGTDITGEPIIKRKQ